MPSAKRDMREALKNRMVLPERPQIAEIPGERAMPGAKLVAVSRVHANPHQPRKHFDAAALDELAASIAARGIMQPLVVRPHDGSYRIIMGERRYRGAILAGLTEVPVIVRDVAEEQAYLDALIENLQRANLTDEEEAEAYRGLLTQGFSIRQIADRLGIAHSKVSRVVRIFDDPTLAAAIIAGTITKSQAQELLVAPEEEKPRLVQFIANRRTSAGPATLNDLRAEVARTRGSGALRTTLDADGHDGSDHAAARALARAEAQRLRRTLDAGLPGLAAWGADPVIAAELALMEQAILAARRRWETPQ